MSILLLSKALDSCLEVQVSYPKSFSLCETSRSKACPFLLLRCPKLLLELDKYS